MKLISILLTAIGLLTFTVSTEVVFADELIPIAAFSSPPTFSQAILSPSGEKMAFMTATNGRKHILVTEFAINKSVLIPPAGKSELDSFFWGNENTLVIRYAVTRSRSYVRSVLTETKILSYNLVSGEYKWLGKPKKKVGKKAITGFSERVVHSLPDDPNHVLLQIDEDLTGRPGVYKTNINTGRRRKIKTGLRGVQSWFADQSGKIRMGFGYYRANRSIESEHRTAILFDADGKSTNLVKTDWFDDYDPVDFSPDPNVIYVSGYNGKDKQGIFTLDVRTGEILDTIFAHDTVDVDGTVRHPVTDNVAGIGYTVDTYKVKYFDKDLAKIQRSLNKALASDSVYITGKARDKNIYLVVATEPNNPGDYYLFDRDTGKLNFVSGRMGAIYPDDMTSPFVTRIETRDGANIPAYVTLPKGAQKGDKLPTVILPHGGPHARDSADWNFWSQFYANRGYAVMQPNFRGSTGFGKKFFEAGQHHWGGVMQDDVTDATLWMIKQGYSDPAKICIVGASYGGYAAMFAPIKEPDLYKCAISINGVPDIPLMKRSDSNYSGFGEWIKNIGLEGQKDETVSPYHRAAEINIPLLLMSSVDDSRVPYKMSQRMQARMEKLKKDSHYIEIANGGHSMVTTAARTTMLKETEKFLAKHIGE